MRLFAVVRQLAAEGVRPVLRHPISSLAIAAILATGIAASTAAFAIVDTFLLRPVAGVTDEASLVTIRFMPPGQAASAFGSATALPDLREAGRRAGLVQLGWACCNNQVAYSSGEGGATSVEGADFVSSQYMATLGITPSVGRLITDAETDHGADVVVISERLWRRDFDGHPSAVGRRVWINQRSFTIVGVLRDFRGWGFSRIGDKDLWAPLSSFASARSSGIPSMSVLVGRLAPRADARVVEQALQQAYQDSGITPRYLAFRPYVESGLWPANTVSQQSTTLAWALALSAALVLVLACANGANLMLIRVGARQRADAIRSALGAPLYRVVGPFVTEAVVLGGAAAIVGVVGARVALSSLGEFRLFAYFPDLSHAAVDIRVVSAAIVVSGLAVGWAALLPLFSLLQTDLALLIGRHVNGKFSRLWTHKGLLVLQIAMTVPIAGTTLVLYREVDRALGSGPTVDIKNVMAISVRPEDAGWSPERSRSYLQSAQSSLNGHGFGDVAVSFPALASDWRSRMQIQTADDVGDDLRLVRAFAVSPSFFRVVDARPLVGRMPDDNSRVVGPFPVVVSKTLAEQLFGTPERAVGRPIRFGLAQTESAPNAVIVAVIADLGLWPGSSVSVGQVFHTQAPRVRSGQILVRFGGPEEQAEDSIRAALSDVSTDVPVSSVRPLEAELRDGLSTPLLLARTGVILSAIALALAVAGSVAVVTQLVRARRDEFAVRLALGAGPASVTLSVLRAAWISVAVGGTAGAVLYLPVPRLLARYLGGAGDFDALSIVGSLLLITVAVTSAAVGPALRAARVPPAEVLRRS